MAIKKTAAFEPAVVANVNQVNEPAKVQVKNPQTAAKKSVREIHASTEGGRMVFLFPSTEQRRNFKLQQRVQTLCDQIQIVFEDVDSEGIFVAEKDFTLKGIRINKGDAAVCLSYHCASSKITTEMLITLCNPNEIDIISSGVFMDVKCNNEGEMTIPMTSWGMEQVLAIVGQPSPIISDDEFFKAVHKAAMGQCAAVQYTMSNFFDQHHREYMALQLIDAAAKANYSPALSFMMCMAEMMDMEEDIK